MTFFERGSGTNLERALDVVQDERADNVVQRKHSADPGNDIIQLLHDDRALEERTNSTTSLCREETVVSSNHYSKGHRCNSAKKVADKRTKWLTSTAENDAQQSNFQDILPCEQPQWQEQRCRTTKSIPCKFRACQQHAGINEVGRRKLRNLIHENNVWRKEPRAWSINTTERDAVAMDLEGCFHAIFLFRLCQKRTRRRKASWSSRPWPS